MIQPTGGVIKNLTISGYNERNENGKVLRGIYLTPATDMVVENCNISGVAYPLNTGAGSVEGKTLTVKNSTLVGWTSFSGKLASASFENCKVGSTVITADNIKTLLNIEGTPAEGALVVE